MSKRRIICLALFLAIPLAQLGADTYTEDFAQLDGAPDGWVIVTPTVAVESEQLTLTPGGAGEVDVFAGQGGSALWFENITQVEFDIAYPGETTSWPYDHGGVILCAQTTAGRYANTCYVVDYLPFDANAVTPGRFRLGKFINGVEGGLTESTPDVTVYEGTWKIDIAATETATTITLTVNDVEQFSYEDTAANRLAPTGHIGFWAYQVPAENKMAVDNLSVEHTPGECPTFLLDSILMTEGKENALVPIRLPIGANDAEAIEVTVTSQDPATASLVNGTLTFEVGDPLVKSVEIEPVMGGQTLLNLAVAGVDCSATTARAEVLASVAFEEDFTQEDGPPEGWFIASDTAEVLNGELSLHAPGQPFVWYAIEGEALNVPKIDAVRCSIRFAQAALPVGAHGGIYLAPQASAARSTGYMIDVIERESDNGFRIYKDNAPEPGLVSPRPPYVWDDQWHDWVLEFTPTGFIFSVDDAQLAEVEDTTYRGGYLSFWCYTGAAGQNMFVDGIKIEFGASACPSITPREAINSPVNQKTVFTVMAPITSNSTTDYELTVTSSAPEVAVPIGAVDGSLVLTFPQGGSLTQTFEAECLSPGTTEFLLDTGETSCLDAFATMTVRDPGEPGFCDDFAQADGPPEDWTIYTGDWQVTGEQLVVECAPGSVTGGETWLWAGDPSPRLEGVETISFSMELSQITPDGVGKHGGVMFFADAPTRRWQTSGYEIDWIDRAGDRGYRFLRSDNGTHTVIGGPTLAEFELGTNWLIDIDGDNIRVSVDEQLIFDIVDPAYREGHFGFWTYCNTTRAVIDDLIVGSCITPPIFPRGDANGDGVLNIADASYGLNWLFIGGPAPVCQDAADANDDGEVNISDASYSLNFQFLGGPPPPDPGSDKCGVDPTEDMLQECEHPEENCPEPAGE